MKPLTFERFRRQELWLIRLNLIVLAMLYGLHLWHFSIDRTPEWPLLWALALRFLWQCVDWWGLQRMRHVPSPATVHAMAVGSTAIHLAFTWCLTLFGDEERYHYVVLMCLPVAAAGFRFGKPAIAAVCLVAIAHSFFEVISYRWVHPPFNSLELFESASVALVYVVVGVTSHILARDLYRSEAELEKSLRQLEATREMVVAQRQQATAGRLARTVAHEVRNPVTLIVSTLEHWRQRGQEVSHEETMELLRLIELEAVRLEKLTAAFLEFARERRLEPADVDARDPVLLAVGLARASAEGAGIDLAGELPDDPLAVRLDPFAVQQVLLNLLRNAIEASPPGGRVRLGVRTRGATQLVYWIENDGAPIPRPVEERLFEPFESTKPGGTGLGLATSRTIARALGGDLVLAGNVAGRVRFELLVPRHAGGPDSVEVMPDGAPAVG